MKKYTLLLFLFFTATYSANSAQTCEIQDNYLTNPRRLSVEEKQRLNKVDELKMIPDIYKNSAFYPPKHFPSALTYHTMFLPVIDTNADTFAAIAIFSKEKDNTLYLDNLIVGPQYQKQGLGKKIRG